MASLVGSVYKADADGVSVLSFSQAQALARDYHSNRGAVEKGIQLGPYTVGQALDDYVTKLESEGKASAGETKNRAEALIKPALGKLDIATLRADRLRQFLDDLANEPARLRTRKGEAQRHREAPDTDDAKRARRSNANRTWAILRAALNDAFAEGHVASDAVWRRIKPFKNVDSARERWLTVEESQRLINASADDFRDLATAALLTGCRYGELARLEVNDFNPDAETIHIRKSKPGKERHVYLTGEATAFFTRLTAGRESKALILTKADGTRWLKHHQARPMRAACKGAKIDPPANFHSLRHTSASLTIMNGAELNVVAHNLGHADTRMVQKHYGHLAPSYIADRIRETAPKFGLEPDGKVVPMRRKKTRA